MRVFLQAHYDVECAHQLNGMRDGHKCARLHGHNYHLAITVSCDEERLVNGMVIDKENLDIDIAPILRAIDHQHLNMLGQEGGGTMESLSKFEPLRLQPTAEHFALWLFKRLAFLSNNGARCWRRSKFGRIGSSQPIATGASDEGSVGDLVSAAKVRPLLRRGRPRSRREPLLRHDAMARAAGFSDASIRVEVYTDQVLAWTTGRKFASATPA